MLKEYIRNNWDGWPLHGLIACLLTLPMITSSYVWVMFGIHCVFWPAREAYQHHGFRNIWTFHRFLEWFVPILASAMTAYLNS